MGQILYVDCELAALDQLKEKLPFYTHKKITKDELGSVKSLTEGTILIFDKAIECNLGLRSFYGLEGQVVKDDTIMNFMKDKMPFKVKTIFIGDMVGERLIQFTKLGVTEVILPNTLGNLKVLVYKIILLMRAMEPMSAAEKKHQEEVSVMNFDELKDLVSKLDPQN